MSSLLSRRRFSHRLMQPTSMAINASLGILEITEADFVAEVEHSAIPVLVDFCAPWCVTCVELGPLLEELAESYRTQILFLKVNVDDCKEVAQRLSIRGIPCLLLFRNGEVVERVIGTRHKAYLTSLLNRYVQRPVGLPRKAAASLRAFQGDEGLREIVAQRVRAHIEAGRIVSHGSNGPISDVDKQRYSLMGAAAETSDVKRFEAAIGVPAAVGRLQEVVHSLLMRQQVDGEARSFHLDPEQSCRPVEWWLAIAVGADLKTLPSHFIQWLLRDLLDDTKRYGVRLTAAARSVLEALTLLHARHVHDDEPSASEWQAVRMGIDMLVKLLGVDEADRPVRLVLTGVEQLAWPADDLDDALARAIGQMLFLATEASTPDLYTPQQWAEQNSVYAELNLSVHRAMRALVPSFPDMTPMQKANVLKDMEGVPEVEAIRAFLERRRPVVEAHSAKVRLRYAEHLHAGLMHALSAAVLFPPTSGGELRHTT